MPGDMDSAREVLSSQGGVPEEGCDVPAESWVGGRQESFRQIEKEGAPGRVKGRWGGPGTEMGAGCVVRSTGRSD